MTKRPFIAVGLVGCLTAPATALGHPPSAADKKNASKECRGERGTIGKEAFARLYCTANSHYKNAFGQCVSQTVNSQQQQS